MVIINLRKLAQVGLVAAAIGLFTNSLNAQQFAYVTNVSGNNVSVVNTADNTVAGMVSIPGSPTGVGVSPDGNFAYVASQANSTVSIISAASRSVVGTVKLGVSPSQLEVSPSGAELYVSAPGANQVVVVDVGSRSVAGVITVGMRPNAIGFNPAGTRAYVANLYSGDVSVIDTSSRAVIATFVAGSGPSSIAVSGDGNTVFVGNQYSGSVTVHTAAGGSLGTIAGFVFPNDLAITPDGQRLFVTNGNGGTVSIVNTSTRSIVNTVPTGSLPTSVAVSPDGSRAYVTNQQSFSLSVLDATSGALLTNIAKVGVYPIGVALQPFTPSSTGPTCTFSLSAASASFPAAASTASVKVTAPDGCPWSATSNSSWVRITSGAGGSGAGTVSYDVDPNAGIVGRTAALTIAGQQVDVSQAGLTCSFTLSSSSASLPATGGGGSVSLTAPAGCTWSALSNQDWLAVGSASGTGPAALTFTAAGNPGLDARTATLTLGGQSFTVTQAGMAFSPIRVNGGGPAFTDGQGRSWAADEQRNRSTTLAAIANTDVPQLYQTESWGDHLLYRFAVPNGSFTITLRFAEIYLSQAGQRVFDILINGQPVASNMDIAAAAGRNTAHDKVFTVNVTNGQIAIEIVAVTGAAKLSGLEIR